MLKISVVLYHHYTTHLVQRTSSIDSKTTSEWNICSSHSATFLQKFFFSLVQKFICKVLSILKIFGLSSFLCQQPFSPWWFKTQLTASSGTDIPVAFSSLLCLGDSEAVWIHFCCSWDWQFAFSSRPWQSRSNFLNKCLKWRAWNLVGVFYTAPKDILNLFKSMTLILKSVGIYTNR